MVRMNWDFVAILKFSKSGTNRRLWDRSVTVALMLQCCVRRLVSTECIVAKRYVLEQKLLYINSL